jgi:hypothetical protein
MAVLLVSLCENGLTESELMETVKEYHWDYENVETLLLDCLRVVLTREEIHSVYECFHFEEEKHFSETQSAFELQTRITLIDSTIRRRIYGYWSTTGGCAFAGNCDVQVSNLGQVQEVVMEGINILELKVRRSEFGGKAQEAMRLLAFLLKDFSKTLFPMTHQNISVSVPTAAVMPGIWWSWTASGTRWT